MMKLKSEKNISGLLKNRLWISISGLLLILMACHSSKEKKAAVEFVCVDQLNEYIEGVEISIDKHRGKTNLEGRYKAEFGEFTESDNIPLDIIAEKNGYLFLGPKTLTVVKDSTIVPVLTFFRGYQFKVRTIKKEDGHESEYPRVIIRLNGDSLGVTDSTGNYVSDYLFRDLDSLMIEARVGKTVKDSIIRLDRTDFEPPPFKFVMKLPPHIIRYCINVITYIKRNNSSNPSALGGVRIYRNGKDVGYSREGITLAISFEDTSRRITQNIKGVWEEKNITREQMVNLDWKNRSKLVPLQFILNDSVTVNYCNYWWTYSEIDDTMQRFIKQYKDKARFYFYVSDHDSVRVIYAPARCKIGDFFNYYVKLNDRNQNIPIRRSDNAQLRKWCFKISDNFHGMRWLDPNRTFRQNGVNPDDIIEIVEILAD